MKKELNPETMNQVINSNAAATTAQQETKATEAVAKSKTSKKDKKSKKHQEAKASETKVKKSKKAKVIKEVQDQQKPSILEEVISQREVKYIYPEDVTDTLSRKKWRQQVRNKLHALERDMYRIQDTNSKEYKAAKKAYEEFKDTVLKPQQIA
jgi:hypothetical protein